MNAWRDDLIPLRAEQKQTRRSRSIQLILLTSSTRRSRGTATRLPSEGKRDELQIVASLVSDKSAPHPTETRPEARKGRSPWPFGHSRSATPPRETCAVVLIITHLLYVTGTCLCFQLLQILQNHPNKKMVEILQSRKN